jgi:membrane associated rhomboid family serine protease
MVPAPVGHHCPDCVEEAKREFRKGPGRRIAVANAKAVSVTKVILVSLVIGYAIEVVAGGAGTLISGPNTPTLVRLGASIGIAIMPPNRAIVGIAVGQDWRLLTSMWLHAGILHLAFNAYALWIFGQMVEEELGRGRFLLIYLLTGLCAGAASYAFAPDPSVAGVGASGAVFGIFGAFVAFNWRRRHTALAQARLRTAAMLLVLNAVIGLGSGGAIDWRAHVGGFIAGILAGFAAEGFGRAKNERAAFVLGCVGVAAVTVALVVWRTGQIRGEFPMLF